MLYQVGYQAGYQEEYQEVHPLEEFQAYQWLVDIHQQPKQLNMVRSMNSGNISMCT